jgi:hypothetical protein
MRQAANGLSALKAVGPLLPSEFLHRIAALSAPDQHETDYGMTESLHLRDEVARYWRIARDLYTEYQDQRARTHRDQQDLDIRVWLVPLFRDVFGYTDITPVEPVTLDGRTFLITHRAVDATVPFLLLHSSFELDRPDAQLGEGGRRRAPFSVVQEFLNADEASLWGFVANGTHLRLLRDNPSLTRPAYLEADLQRIFEEELYAEFATLWLTIHASRLRPTDGKLCILERWRSEAEKTGIRALDHLRDSVTEALRALGSGFLHHAQNEELRRALNEGKLTADEYFQELLRLVYRLLFLFVSEERGLLHEPSASDAQKELYREGYSIGHLRDRALRRRHYDRHADLWAGLQIVFRALADGEPALGLPALGGLFSTDQCSHLDRATIANEALLCAIRALAFFPSGSAIVRVNYRDLGTEELGSVYESLLELHATVRVDTSPWTFELIGADSGKKGTGSARKLTGSYYTPVPLVNELLRSALEPVIAQTLQAHPDRPQEALLALRIVDPACGSGHFLLAAARRLALELARLDTGGDAPDELARQHALREVVRHCIYGVDRNPLAVELCKAALWIETVEPGKPLSFLDAHIQCGDSLIGIMDPAIMANGIPDEAYHALSGDDKAVCGALKRRNRMSREGVQGNLFDQEGFRSLSVEEAALELMPEDSVADVAAKRRAWEAALADQRRRNEELRADLFVSAFFAPKTTETSADVPTNEDLHRLQHGMSMRPQVEVFARKLARGHRFFHWHVAFAEIMQRGGFDVVLGNPPWERVKLQEKEFFAQRKPAIASAPNKAARQARISALRLPGASPLDNKLWQDFIDAKRGAEASSAFIRSSGRFPLTGRGDVNTYAVFAETFLQLLNASGRAGLIVPTGIATDSTTSHFFADLISNQRLVSLFDFENREGLFPAVDSRYKFSLLTLGSKRSDPQFVFFATNVAQLGQAHRSFTLSASDLASVNPNTRTAPVFRSRADAELTKKIYQRVPVLVNESKGRAGNPWGIRFGRMFDMSNDSKLFRDASQFEAEGAHRDSSCWVDRDGARWLPLYEAKMIDLYDHRAGSYETRGDDRGYRVLPRTKDEQYRNPSYEPVPFYWVCEDDVRARTPTGWDYRWFFAFKDITAPTNERTVIAAAIPYSGVGHSIGLIFAAHEPQRLSCLLGNMCSLPLDYVARQKVGGLHLTFFYVEQFPILPPSAYSSADVAFIRSRVLELTYTSSTMRDFARDNDFVGPPFGWDSDRRTWLRAELDAYYACLYGLTRDELRYILDPSDVYGSDFPSETFRVLKERELREYGKYRTARLVLEAWDRLERERDCRG